ncbi:MAG: MFS transporter [Cyanobacteria bacterium]|nr:MFS transporter [Cyanobacteriota bacterium]
MTTTSIPNNETKNGLTTTVIPILWAISFCHLLNDLLQSLIPAIYPMIKQNYQLDYTQIGLITLTYQLTASFFQPLVGYYTDLHPKPFFLPMGMGFSFLGLILLAFSNSFETVLFAAAMIGVGSSVFHPESSRVARLASGGQHGLAQSFFQVGGNIGSSLGPLLAAFIILPYGQESIGWFSGVALLAITLLWAVSRWYKHQGIALGKSLSKNLQNTHALSKRQVITALSILVILVFSKVVYLASLSSYYSLYLIHRFHLSIQDAQVYLFLFMGSVAIGTILGGPIGDKLGRKLVIWCSILGVLPFTLLLPHADLTWTAVLSIIIGLILSSAFSAIVVFAQELVPGKVGMISGLFFGLAFGVAGLGAAALGKLADMTSIETVYQVCAFLPAIGLLAGFLPGKTTQKSY